MKMKRFCALLAIATLFILNTPALSAPLDMMGEFTDALYRQDALKMESVVEKNKAGVPGKINKLIEEALSPELSKAHKEQRFYLLERLATVYKDVTGDLGPLIRVKKESFESRLNPVVVSVKSGGLHIVETISTDTVKNLFKPDNIIINSGDAVRWVNNDRTIHLFASVMTSIGEGGIFSPNVHPGESWERTFNLPGEYYYICFIHKIMYGKILVNE